MSSRTTKRLRYINVNRNVYLEINLNPGYKNTEKTAMTRKILLMIEKSFCLSENKEQFQVIYQTAFLT